MVMASKFGQMVPNTRVNGKMIRLTATENSFMPMETFMKDSGKMIRPMAREAILMQTVPPM